MKSCDILLSWKYTLFVLLPMLSLVACGKSSENSTLFLMIASDSLGPVANSESVSSSNAVTLNELIALPDTGTAPLEVFFDVVALSGEIQSIIWEFGDGFTGEGTSISHTFQESGLYTVSVSVDASGQHLADSVVICVVPQRFSELPLRIEEFRHTNFPETNVAYWIESPQYGVLHLHSDEVLPSASLIKAFILIVAYIEFSNFWNEIPEALDTILNPYEPAMASLRMFDVSTRFHIQEKLSGMTYRDLAISMMGSNQNQIGNSAYNASANILIYLLGGPAECTRKIRSISPDFGSVYVGRYMLESRSPDNDNSNSLSSLAAAYRMIATETLPGAYANDFQELRSCFQTFDYMGNINYQKHGHLSTAPSLTAWAGWIEKNSHFYFYCVSVLYEDGVSLEDRGANHYLDIIKETLMGL